MRYYKVIDEDGYIISIGKGNGNDEITKEEYDHILSVIHSRPVAEEGYNYKLRTDLTWELCEIPPVAEEDTEATEEDLRNALSELGVSI